MEQLHVTPEGVTTAYKCFPSLDSILFYVHKDKLHTKDCMISTSCCNNAVSINANMYPVHEVCTQLKHAKQC